MADSSPQAAPEADTSGLKNPKDRTCPFCNQSFTSSSLGRHLDLFIRERNPKAPDNIHDVEQIRQLRGGITRRNAKSRKTSTPVGTPGPTAGGASRSPVRIAPAKRRRNNRDGDDDEYDDDEQEDGDGGEEDDEGAAPAPAPTSATAATPKYPFTPRWEATGVINDIPAAVAMQQQRAESDQQMSEDGGSEVGVPAASPGGGGLGIGPGGGIGGGGGGGGGQAGAAGRPLLQRTFSKQLIQKAQFDVKQRVQDALDTAKAAELALRELLSSWRAAK